MGMQSVGVSYTNKDAQTTSDSRTYGCTGTTQSPCQPTYTQPFTTNVDNLPEGNAAIGSTATDVLGKAAVASPTVTVKVDRTAPTGTLTVPPEAAYGTTSFSGTMTDPLSGPGRWVLEATADGTLNWQQVCAATQPIADGTWSCSWNTDTTAEGTYQLRARLEDSVSAANGGPNVAFTDSASIQIDRTAPVFPTSTSVGSNYVADTDTVIVDWDTASDPNLADGSEGSGVGAYEYRLRVNGGAWSDAITTADITAAVPSANPGDTIDVDLKAYDMARNPTTSQMLQLTARSDCLNATDIGFLSECQTSEMDQPDSTPDEEVDLIEQPTLLAAGNARRFTIDVAGGPWTTIRNAPNSLVIGNAMDGWTFDRTRGTYNDTPGVPNSDLGWRAGKIHGLFDSCGWIQEKSESGAADKFVDSDCPAKTEARISQRVIAPGYNCMGCNRGTRLKLIRPTPMWANVTPNPSQGRPKEPNGSPIRTISQADVDRDYYVDWRYVTKPIPYRRNFIMVRDVGFDKSSARKDNANGVWVFIKRSALPRGLCQKSVVTVASGCGSTTT